MLSVIIPIYNAAPYLERCLLSIAGQSYVAWEAILVDDASTDESRQIAERFAESDSRFILLRNSSNRGQAASRNMALSRAKGDLVLFVDADDWVDVDFFETAETEIGSADVLQFAPHRYQYTTPWSLVIRRSFLESHALRFPEGMIYEDVVFAARLWQASPTIQLSSYRGYHYAVHPSSTTARPHSTQLVRRTLREMHIHLWQYRWLRLRLAAHFIKERIFFILKK